MEKQMSQVYKIYFLYKFHDEVEESLMQNICMIT